MSARFTSSVALAVAFTLASSLVGLQTACAQFLPDPILLDSFEGTGGNVSDWGPQNDWVGLTPGDPNVIYISHSQSSVGVTNGSNSLALEMGSGTGWGVTLTANDTDADLTLYNAFNTVAQDPTAWFLEGDLTFDASSWANVSPPASPPFRGLYQFNLAIGDNVAFGQNPATADLYGQVVHVPIRVSVNDLEPDPFSTYYQLYLGGSNVFQAGGTPEAPLGAVVYVDNLRFTPAPPSVPLTLFSWETPAGGNGEEFEGWSDCGLGCMNDPPDPHTGTHRHTVISNSPAATDGTHVLQIDNTVQNDPSLVPDGFRFYWGSTYQLDSNVGTEEEPMIDEVIQARIDDLKEIVDSASAFAFDVHFQDLFNGNAYDPFSPTPTFVRFALAINDGTGAWFQAEGTALAGTPDPNEDDTFEYIIGTNIMSDVTTNARGILGEVGLLDSSQFNLVLAVNANGGLLAEIDNFRAIIEVDLSADFDNDGDVDDQDLVVWEMAYGASDAGDADADGDTDGNDFFIWQKTFGNDASQESVIAFSAEDLALLGISTAVPEPTTGLLAVLVCLAASAGRAKRS